MTTRPTVSLIEGDGIGPEIAAPTGRAVEAAVPPGDAGVPRGGGVGGRRRSSLATRRSGRLAQVRATTYRLSSSNSTQTSVRASAGWPSDSTRAV